MSMPARPNHFKHEQCVNNCWVINISTLRSRTLAFCSAIIAKKPTARHTFHLRPQFSFVIAVLCAVPSAVFVWACPRSSPTINYSSTSVTDGPERGEAKATDQEAGADIALLRAEPSAQGISGKTLQNGLRYVFELEFKEPHSKFPSGIPAIPWPVHRESLHRFASLQSPVLPLNPWAPPKPFNTEEAPTSRATEANDVQIALQAPSSEVSTPPRPRHTKVPTPEIVPKPP
jgi:hypothetical protein